MQFILRRKRTENRFRRRRRPRGRGIEDGYAGFETGFPDVEFVWVGVGGRAEEMGWWGGEAEFRYSGFEVFEEFVVVEVVGFGIVVVIIVISAECCYCFAARLGCDDAAEHW